MPEDKEAPRPVQRGPWIEEIPRCKGYYLLLLMLSRKTLISHPKFTGKPLGKGFYIYIGSARGYGGIRARIQRHLKREKKLVWHIDYLTSNPNTRPIALACVCSEAPGGEHELSVALSEKAEPALEGFGSTDTRDKTHLYKCAPLKNCIELLEETIKRIAVNTSNPWKLIHVKYKNPSKTQK